MRKDENRTMFILTRRGWRTEYLTMLNEAGSITSVTYCVKIGDAEQAALAKAEAISLAESLGYTFPEQDRDELDWSIPQDLPEVDG